MLGPEPIATFDNVEDFLVWLQGQDARYELDNGRVLAMAGGTALHADIAANILTALRNKLKATACRAFHGDMAVRTHRRSIRLPDVAIYCDPRDVRGDLARRTAFEQAR